MTGRETVKRIDAETWRKLKALINDRFLNANRKAELVCELLGKTPPNREE